MGVDRRGPARSPGGVIEGCAIVALSCATEEKSNLYTGETALGSLFIFFSSSLPPPFRGGARLIRAYKPSSLPFSSHCPLFLFYSPTITFYIKVYQVCHDSLLRSSRVTTVVPLRQPFNARSIELLPFAGLSLASLCSCSIPQIRH